MRPRWRSRSTSCGRLGTATSACPSDRWTLRMGGMHRPRGPLIPLGVSRGGMRVMATVELTNDNFHEVTSSGLVLVDFWAAWCGPCRWFAPVFERAAQRHGDIVFAKMDTEAQPELAATFGIMSIPTLMVIRDNIVLYAQPGALPEAALEDLIGKAKALDMDDVRRRVSEQASNA